VVNVENELVKEVKAHSEITVATLNKIGLKKVNENQWICKASAEEMRWMMLVLEQAQLLSSLLRRSGDWRRSGD